MDRDAALLAATFAEREDVIEDVEVDTRPAIFMKIIIGSIYQIS